MIPALEQTPPIIAWLLGFFVALSLKRKRIEPILDRFLPTGEHEGAPDENEEQADDQQQ